MPKITNESYKQFQEKGVITLLTKDEVKQALKNVDGIHGKNIKEGRALLICLYYTGARPIEVLQLTGKDVYKEGSYIKIQVSTAKKGLPRVVSLPYRNKLARELYLFAQSNFRDRLLFYNYISKRRKSYTTNKGEREYIDTTDRLRYHVMKWFKGVRQGSITPYFLRHNRFSALSNAGASPQDIKFLKGGRSIDSVNPYLHLSTKKSEELAKMIK